MPWAYILIIHLSAGAVDHIPFATAEACHQAKQWAATSSAVRAECFSTGAATISHLEE